MADQFSINFWEERELPRRWTLFFGHLEHGDEPRWMLYYNGGAFSYAATQYIPRNWEIICMGKSYG